MKWNGRVKKTPHQVQFLFRNFSAQNLKILVPTPQNTLVDMWGKDMNFQVSVFVICHICVVIIKVSEIYVDPP